MTKKWECIGFEFPQEDEEYPDSVVKVIMDMLVSPVRISKVEADTISAAPELLEGCEKALQFIQNGIDLGYIRMPDPEIPDSAHGTPDLLRAAIAKAKGKKEGRE